MIHSAVGYDVSVHLVEKHSVRRGSCAPSIEMGSKAWIVLIKELQDGSTRNVLKAALGSMATQARVRSASAKY